MLHALPSSREAVMRTALAGVIACCLLASRGAATLQDGDVLGPDNWVEAQGLLPEEILDHYRKGEYINRIADHTQPGYISIDNPPDFREASRTNRGRYELSPLGSIIDRNTGKQPGFIFGLPFPDIDPADAQAGTKVIWNYFYTFWYNGNQHFLTELVMLGRTGVERRIVTDVQTLMYDGAPWARGRANPNNLLLQQFARGMSPAD